jgi:hypothetical protein
VVHHGHTVPGADISEAIYSATARGVLLTDLAWYARLCGFRTKVRTGTFAELVGALARGLPPIVMLDLASPASTIRTSPRSPAGAPTG